MSFKRQLLKIYDSIPILGDIRTMKNEILPLNFEITRQKTMSAIATLDFELSRHPRYSDPKRLFKYSTQVSSQNQEDGMINEIFQRVGITNRVFVEVGIGDGTENNTAFLLSQGWTGFWMDGDSSFLNTIANRRDLQQNCILGKAAFVNKENISDHFKQMGVPTEFDFMSLDIDQNTYYIWQALKEYRPRVVVIEYNGTIPANVDWKVNYSPDRVWDRTHNFGASLKAYENLGREMGYSLVGCDFIGINAFFVRDDLVGDHFEGPFTSENHHEPPRFAYIHRRGHYNSILDRKI